MTLRERLSDFAGALASATDAPDEYMPTGYVTYENNMADLKDLWSQIKPNLKNARDVGFIDARLHEAFVAFEAGEKEKGRKAIWDIYNLDVKKLR